MEHPIEALSVEAPACVHHWKLGSPVGGVTSGLCRDCGMIRDFTEQASPHPYLSRARRK
jgi:hypothetical protein